MIKISLENRIDKLFDELKEGKTRVDLKNGETLYLSNDELLQLYTEAINFAVVVDNEGREIKSDFKFDDLSDQLKKMVLAYPGQEKIIDVISSLAKGVDPDDEK